MRSRYSLGLVGPRTDKGEPVASSRVTNDVEPFVPLSPEPFGLALGPVVLDPETGDPVFEVIQEIMDRAEQAVDDALEAMRRFRAEH